MSTITSIATSVPAFKHAQDDLCHFAGNVYAKEESEKRKLKYLYHKSGISSRYSVVPDFSKAGDKDPNRFFANNDTLEPFPTLEERMQWYSKEAVVISIDAITKCIEGYIDVQEITHLITVSCTGMSAPGLDLQIMEALQLPNNLIRSSVNFMGCYAAIHALKIADAFCTASPDAKVVIVCTELCTLHFQKENSIDNITSSLLFGDGAAAILVQGKNHQQKGITLDGFYSMVSFKGKNEMSWELSGSGFLMTLTGYVPDLIKEDFKPLVTKALEANGKSMEDVTHWCIHPGGKKILESIADSLGIGAQPFQYSYEVLLEYGNMSSPTILFVLKKILDELRLKTPISTQTIFGAAFGPGLTMETFTASYA